MKTQAAVAAGLSLLLLASCFTQARPGFTGAPAGAWKLDPAHSSLVWKVSHRGLSSYTARFTRISAALSFDPANPEAAALDVRVDPASVRTDHPGGDDWDRELAAGWFRAGAYPEIRYVSRRITRTGENSGIVEGELTFLGQTRPVALTVIFNGTAPSGGPGSPPAMGFSARASLSRSDFGLNRLPSLVGDQVDLLIEAEFLAARAGDART